MSPSDEGLHGVERVTMNRKFLAGAAASLMLTSLPVAITAAGAGAVKPTITGVSVTHDANHQYLSSTQLGINETATVAITGTGYNGGGGTYSLAVKATPGVTVNSVSRVSSTEVDANVTVGIGVGATKALKDAALTLTVPVGNGLQSAGGAAKFKTGLHEVSNCGYSFPLAQSGKTYATVGGSLDINNTGSNFTGTNPAVTYFDVNILGTNPLCSPDVIAPTTVPTTTPSWALNYPVDFSGAYGQNLTTDKHNANFGLGKVREIGFSFPYTTAQTLHVYGSTTTYKVVGAKVVGGCSVEGDSPVVVDSCVATPKGIVVTSNAVRTYNQGDTISSPIIKLTGVGLKTSPIQLIPVSNISYIGLSGTCTPGPAGNCLGITFAPRAKTANAAFAPISIAAS